MASWFGSPPPDAAVSIAPDVVAVAVSSGTRRGLMALQGYASEPLSAGAVHASLNTPNLVDRPAVVQALRAALDRLGARPRRVALVVPDLVAKVSLLRFDRIPSRYEDLDSLVRWQVKKSTPFPVDTACLTWSPGVMQAGGGGELVVAVARPEVIAEYEGICDEFGMHAGLVDLATHSLVNLLLATPSPPAGDWLVVHVQPEYTSMAIMRGADLIFFRNRAEDSQDTLPDLVHQTSMYYQDRLAGQGFTQVLLTGRGQTPGALDQARRSLGERLGTAVDAVDPRRAAAFGEPGPGENDLQPSLAPLVGVLLRARAEMAGA